MFEKADAHLIFGAENRFYFTRMKVSSGCVILTRGGAKYYVSDSRYETYLKQGLKDYKIVIVPRAGFYKAVRETLSAEGVKVAAFEDDELPYAGYLTLKKELKGVKLARGAAELAKRRAVKDDAEIELILKAQSLTARAFAAGVAALKEGVTEREVAAEAVYAMLSGGADGTAFDPIISFGENSAKPHHAPGDRKLKKGDAALFDMGAKYGGYCSDMTRTVFYGEPAPELIKIYGVVLAAQSKALRYLRAGITCRKADAYARGHIAAAGFDKYFGHGTGHGLGVKIHESPSLSPDGREKLSAGMVVTVEPGIYIPDVGGVRIEDMARVTEGGCVNLTEVDKKLTIIN